jgi:hypothetical protein
MMRVCRQGDRILGLIRTIAHIADDRTLRFLAVVAFGLALGACSKCDVPTWRHDSPAAPQSCHDGPAAQ